MRYSDTYGKVTSLLIMSPYKTRILILAVVLLTGGLFSFIFVFVLVYVSLLSPV